jgi:hypothetical protein
MAKKVVRPLIYEGQLDYYLRIQINPPTGTEYITEYFYKNDYSLNDVESIRNRRLEYYEEKGWRVKRKPSNNGYTSGYLKSKKIK